MKRSSNPMFGLLAIALTLPCMAVPAYAALDTKSLPTEMQRETLQFDKVSKLVTVKEECVPVRVGGMGFIDIQYLSCSDDAMRRDGEEYRISDDFVVPQGIAYRFNFWRRVYSLWSRNQYVLHAGDIPDVVFEIHDSSRIEDLGDKTREKAMKPGLTVRRQQYQQILLKLHRMKSIDVALLSPVELRVYKLFDHVQVKDKFLVAAQSLRVQRGQREYIEKGLEVAPRYLPHIEEEFKKQGLSPELARIAFIESSFNLQAYSKVGASGIYQIMPGTAHDYMILNDGIDERNDPIKASRAAAKLLMLNYKILGAWPLAITAYNHGVGGIRRAMQATGSNDIVTLINKYDGANFGFASKNFYSGFLGLLATLKNANKVFPNMKMVDPLEFDTVRVGGMSISQVKARYKLTNASFSYLNPDISRSFIREEGIFPSRYVLKVPAKARDKNLQLTAWRP
jgi:membrane-bound lytic murein transglycosylase D